VVVVCFSNIVPVDSCNASANEVKKLVASDRGPGHWFGSDSSVSGDIAVVGAHLNGQGAAYVFQRDHGGPNNWGEVRILLPSDRHHRGTWPKQLTLIVNVVKAPSLHHSCRYKSGLRSSELLSYLDLE
jgi:hypothetical protein